MPPRRRQLEEFDGVEALIIDATVNRPELRAGEVHPDGFGITTSLRFPRRWKAHGASVLAWVASHESVVPGGPAAAVERLIAAYGIPSDWGGPDAA